MPRGSSQGPPDSAADNPDKHFAPPAGPHELSDELRESGQTPEGTAEKNRPSWESSGPQGAWWQRLIELAAVIAVPPALFYVLGLGALWVQLASEYDLPGNDNAWFAASLVARPSAAGLGAEVLLRGLLFSMVVAALLLFVAYIVFKRREPNRQVIRLPPMILPVSAAVLGLLLFIVTSAEDRAPLVPTFRIVGGLVVLYFFSFFLYWILGGEARMYVGRAFAFYPRWLYSVIAVLAVLCVGGSVLFPEETRLPCLYRETAEGYAMDGGVISAQRAEELEDYRTLEGGFLGHSEGHWYVFDEENLQLEAIPDDEASRVIEGEFYVAYTRIGSEGKPVGDSVTEEETKSGETYTLSGGCNPPTQ